MMSRDLDSTTLLISLSGRIVCARGECTTTNPEPKSNALISFRAQYQMDHATKMVDMRRRPLVLFQFLEGAKSKQLFDILSKNCDIVGVGRGIDNDGRDVYSAIARRLNYTMIDEAYFGTLMYCAPNINGRSIKHRDDRFFACIVAWVEFQSQLLTNFHVVFTDEVTTESILDGWANRDILFVHADIQMCCATQKVDRTARQSFVVEHRSRLEQMHKDITTPRLPSLYLLAGDSTVPDIRTLTTSPSSLMCTYIDVVTGHMGRFSLKEWFREWHGTRSLVLHGAPGLCKTPVAKSSGLILTEIHPQADGTPSRLYVCAALEQLPRIGLRSGDCILFDEFGPDKRRGCNPPHTVDELKAIMDSEVGGGLSGKGQNSRMTGSITFPDRVTRIFTTNAASPHEGSSHFPEKLYDMSPTDILALDQHVRALLKRVAFCHVQTRLLPDDAIKEHRGASIAAAVVEFDRLFGAGPSAIP